MRIVSWNVNGIRAASRKGFLEWFGQLQPDILCVQETKAQPQQLTADLLEPAGYHAYWSSAERKGYSGTLIYTSVPPLQVDFMGEKAFDCEGRVLVAYYTEFVLLNCYFPNSQHERARIQYKLEFNEAIHKLVQRLGADGHKVVLCGDYNVAHREIDLARPDENHDSPGFLPEERAWMSQFLDSGFTDTFRYFCQEGEHYSWWSYRSAARQRNIGWRIDYFCVNKVLEYALKNAEIWPTVQGSDHCPVTLDLDFSQEENS